MINPYGLTEEQESHLKELLLGTAVPSKEDIDSSDTEESSSKPLDIEESSLMHDASDTVEPTENSKILI